MGAIRPIAIIWALATWGLAILAALPLSANAEVQLTALFNGAGDPAEAKTQTFNSATYEYYGPQDGRIELSETQAAYVTGRQVCSPDAPVEGKVAIVEWQDATCRQDMFYDAMHRAGAKALVVMHRDFAAIGRDYLHHSSWDTDAYKKSMIMVEVNMAKRQARWAESDEAGSLRVSIGAPHSTVYWRYYQSWDYIFFLQVLLPLLHFWATFIAFLEMRRQYAVSKERAQAPSTAPRSPTGRKNMSQADHFIALRFCCAVEVVSMGSATILLACGVYGPTAMPITVMGWFYTLFLGLQMFGSTVLAAVMHDKLSILQQQPGETTSTFLGGRRRLRLGFNLVVMLALDGIYGMLIARDTPHINGTLDVIWFLVMFLFFVFIIRTGSMLIMQGRRISKTARGYKARGASNHYAALKHVAFWVGCSGWAIVAQLVCLILVALFFLDGSSNPRPWGGVTFLTQLCRIIKSIAQTQAMRPAGSLLALLIRPCQNCPCPMQVARVSGETIDEKISTDKRSSESELVLTMGYSESFSFKAPNERLSTILSSLADSQGHSSSGSGSEDAASRTDEPTHGRHWSLWAGCCARLCSTHSIRTHEADRSPPVPSDGVSATTVPETQVENETTLAVEMFRADAEQGFQVEGIAGFVEY